MRRFTYVEPGEDDEPVFVTVSEEEIRQKFWPYWYGKMCGKFGKEHVDANYTFEHCLDDWMVVNWALPSME